VTISDVPTQTLPAEGEVGVVDIGSLTLESGVVLDDVSIALQRWGELSPTRDNVVVVLHALTGDYPAATASHQRALALARAAGDWMAEATALRVEP